MEWNGCLGVEFCSYESHQSRLGGPLASVILRGDCYFVEDGFILRSLGSIHFFLYILVKS